MFSLCRCLLHVIRIGIYDKGFVAQEENVIDDMIGFVAYQMKTEEEYCTKLSPDAGGELVMLMCRRYRGHKNSRMFNDAFENNDMIHNPLSRHNSKFTCLIHNDIKTVEWLSD